MASWEDLQIRNVDTNEMELSEQVSMIHERQSESFSQTKFDFGSHRLTFPLYFRDILHPSLATADGLMHRTLFYTYKHIFTN